MVRRGLNSAALQLLTSPFHKVTGNFKCGKGASFLEGRVGETGSRWKISINISRACPTWLPYDIARSMEGYYREQGLSDSIEGGTKSKGLSFL